MTLFRDTPDLKPCPFPHDVQRGLYIDVDDEEFDAAHVGCSDCGAFGPYVMLSDFRDHGAAKKEAADLWNKRRGM